MFAALMRDLVQDIRYAWRQLRHAPGFTSIAVLTLALGIGANTAFFAIIDALAFRPIPVAKLDGTFAIATLNTRSRRSSSGLPVSGFRALEAHPPPAVVSVAADGGIWPVTVQIPGKAERIRANAISGGYARLLDVPPQAGRWIAPDDDTAVAARVAVVSDRLWREWFGADRDVIGHATLKINLVPFTIVGVAPPAFQGVHVPFESPDVWLSLSSMPAVFSPWWAQNVAAESLLVFVKPGPGTRPADLEGAVRGAVLAPGTLDTTFKLIPAGSAMRNAAVTSSALIVLSLSSLVLLAACANLANMLYARGAKRAGETAVRLSLGASSTRILRLFLAETAILAALSAALGLLIAVGATSLLAAAVPALGAGWNRVTLDLAPDSRVFFYACGAGTFAAILVGFTTAWRSSRVPPLRSLASSGAPSGMTARGGWLRTALVAVQITVAVVLVMGAGLYVERFREARDRNGPPVHYHFDEALLATASVDLDLLHYNEPRGRAFFDRLLADARKIPGVEQAAIADGLPTSSSTSLTVEDPPGGRTGFPRMAHVSYARVSPGFLATIGVPLRRGRDVAPSDVAGGTRVAVLSESAAAALWPGQDPIGKRVKFGPWEWLTVVGLAADPMSSADTGPLRPSNVMFIPFAQWYRTDGPGALIVVRTAAPAAQLEPLRAVVRAIDEDVAVFDASTRDDYMRQRYGEIRAFTVLMTSLGGLALGIAMLGVYGVIAYFVSTRTREFGIRLALGATPARVIRMVVDHAIHLVLVGLLAGVFVTSVGSRLIESRVIDLMPNDIATWVVVPLLILAAGVLAGYLPARRAARVHPNVALRDL
jgi:predicted permease